MSVQSWVKGLDGFWVNAGVSGKFVDRDFLVYGEYSPGPDTTGPVGVLTPHSGDITTSSDGQVIEGLDVDGRIIVQHHGVLIRNCHVRSSPPPGDGATGQTWTGIQLWSRSSPVTRIVDCEIEASAYPVVGSTEAVGGYDFIIERCNIHGFVDGIKTNFGNAQVLGCWVHDLPWYAFDPVQTDGSHNDGVQGIGSSGQTDGPVIVRGNRFECGYRGTSGMLVTQPAGTTVHELVIDRNWFVSTQSKLNATATGLNLAQKDIPIGFGGPVRVTGNRFSAWNGSEGARWRTDHDGLIDEQTYDAAVISGNTWLDGVTPAKITRIRVE